MINFRSLCMFRHKNITIRYSFEALFGITLLRSTRCMFLWRTDNIPLYHLMPSVWLGGSPTRKIFRFNTTFFRKDKWGIIL